jgi:hypothetical protein
MDPILGVKSPHQTKLFGILNPCSIKPKTRRIKSAPEVIKNWPMGHG